MATATAYSRANPSPRYRQLLSEYVQLHEQGEKFLALPAEQTFPGLSVMPHAMRLAELAAEHHARTLLDYGAGKGAQYRSPLRTPDGRVFESLLELWNVESMTCYDPAFAPFRAVPQGTFHGVICTDVLEHCPEEDAPWILSELFGYAERFLFLNVACYPARKRLPNGENAHCTIKPTEWWIERLAEQARHRPAVRFECVLKHPVDPHGHDTTVLRG